MRVIWDFKGGLEMYMKEWRKSRDCKTGREEGLGLGSVFGIQFWAQFLDSVLGSVFGLSFGLSFRIQFWAQFLESVLGSVFGISFIRLTI